MRKVLVLEDEPNIRSFVVINLKRAGYETIEAGDGEEALELIHKNPDIKVALLDIMLPVRSTALRCAAVSGRATPKWVLSCSPPGPRRWTRSPA